jgi:methanogenic corrinoid protein MtbC1
VWFDQRERFLLKRLISKRVNMRKGRSTETANEDSAGDDARRGPDGWRIAQKPVEGLAREAIRRLAGQDWDPSSPGPALPPNDVMHDFIDTLLAGDAEKGFELVERQRINGRSYQMIAESLFADAARHIGAAWSADALSLVEVSVGTSTLLRINSMTRRAFERPMDYSRGIVVFASLPAQAHTLGLILATEAFRQKGIDVELMLGCDADEIIREVRDCGARLVGLTAGRHDRLADILSLATKLKDCPDPPAVLVGGSAASEWHESIGEGVIDCIAETIDQALYFADGLKLG